MHAGNLVFLQLLPAVSLESLSCFCEPFYHRNPLLVRFLVPVALPAALVPLPHLSISVHSPGCFCQRCHVHVVGPASVPVLPGNGVATNVECLVLQPPFRPEAGKVVSFACCKCMLLLCVPCQNSLCATLRRESVEFYLQKTRHFLKFQGPALGCHLAFCPTSQGQALN